MYVVFSAFSNISEGVEFEYFMIELAALFGFKLGAESIHYDIIKDDKFSLDFEKLHQANICDSKNECSIDHQIWGGVFNYHINKSNF